jgi:hypothetical protein
MNGTDILLEFIKHTFVLWGPAILYGGYWAIGHAQVKIKPFDLEAHIDKNLLIKRAAAERRIKQRKEAREYARQRVLGINLPK